METCAILDAFKGAEESDRLLPVIEREMIQESGDPADTLPGFHGEEERVSAVVEHGVLCRHELGLLLRTQGRHPHRVMVVKLVRQVNEILQLLRGGHLDDVHNGSSIKG